jgi:hypothetical protein
MKIGNPSLRASCRELNTYRAAFVHVDSYEEVKHGRELCNQVDQSEISKTCLERLQLYIANAGFDQKPFKPQVNEPIPEDMFPDSIAGVPAMQNRHCGPQLFFTGRIDCAGSYGSAGKHLVAVYVAQWPESEPSSAPPVFTHIETTMAPTKERHAGSIVTRYQGKWGSAEQRPDGTILSYQHQSNALVWYSNNRFLEIVFYDPIPQQEQFLSYYLRRYPGGSD